MKTTIKAIYEIKPVDTKYGQKFKLDLELNDQTRGRSSLVKSKDSYKVGDEIEYTVSDDTYKNIVIKEDKKAWTGWNKTDYAKEKVLKALEFWVNISRTTGLNTRVQDSMDAAEKYLARLTEKWL